MSAILQTRCSFHTTAQMNTNQTCARISKPHIQVHRNALVASRPTLHQNKLHAQNMRIYAGAIQDVDEATLEFEVANRDRPLIIDFYATWCGPCLLMADELKKAQAELGDSVKILKLDTDKYPDISTQLQIQGLPTLVFVGTDPSKPALRTEGLLPAATIVQIVQNELGTAPAAQ